MTNTLKKISVIVPIYNGETYLSECIESILKQTYENIELILVNDGSKDNSKNIIDKYALLDNRIKAIHKENSGVSDSRNVGLKNTTGDYICFVDQDDYIDKFFLEYLYNILVDNNADISLTPTAYRFDNKNKNLVKQDIVETIEIWSGEEATKQMLYYNLIIAPWNKLIKKEIITKNNIQFHSNLFGGEGFCFSVECFEHSTKIAVGKKKLYNYRVDNPNSGMTRFNLKVIYSSIEAQKVIKDSLVHKNVDTYKACKYANWHTYCDCLNTIIGCKVVKEYKLLYNKIYKVCRHDALSALSAPITYKEKIKAIFYFISPKIASKVINHFRIRKFSIEK